MARYKLFVETDRQIARAILRQGSASRRELVGRANIALVLYRRKEAIGGRYEYEKRNSPFLPKDQRSTSDTKSGRVNVRGDHLEIEINAPAAGYVESGNQTADIKTQDPMFIRVRSRSVWRKKGKRGGTKLSLTGGAPVQKIGSRYYVVTKKVTGFSGYRLLSKSVRLAFRR